MLKAKDLCVRLRVLIFFYSSEFNADDLLSLMWINLFKLAFLFVSENQLTILVIQPQLMHGK